MGCWSAGWLGGLVVGDLTTLVCFVLCCGRPSPHLSVSCCAVLWQALVERRLPAPLLELHAHREQRKRLACRLAKGPAAAGPAGPRRSDGGVR